MAGVITDIRPSSKRPERASVMVDGKFAISLSHRRIDDMGLAVGMNWDDTLAAQVVRARLVEKATKAAMNRLNRRPMSRRQLQQKLLEKEHPPDIVNEVLDKAQAVGALDDEAYARTLARELTLHRHAGPAMLRMRLRAKGIDRAVIDVIVSEIEQSDTQMEQALRLARKKIRSLTRCDAMTRKRRLWAAMARRGYSRDVMETVLNELLSEHESDEVDG
jgi:regulatory protein